MPRAEQLGETPEQRTERRRLRTLRDLGILTAPERERSDRLWAESVEGEGTSFHFTLPAARRHAGTDAAPGTVLIVEDDPALGEVLRQALIDGDGAPRLVRTPRVALDAVQTATPAARHPRSRPARRRRLLARRAGSRRRHPGRHPAPVYTALDLTAGHRERLQLARTEFLSKATTTPQEVTRRVAELLGQPTGPD